jgi:WD40 repeat protein
VPGAHGGVVTHVQFASDKSFVSAGRDKRLVLCNVSGDSAPTVADESDQRADTVPVLGVNPERQQVMFDDLRGLRVVSYKTRRIEGVLQNPPGAVGFSTMALFSPDGKTILTNGNAPGRIQLWRAPTTANRAAELRQFVWTNGIATCGAFAPDGTFAITGTQDHQVLIWDMPTKAEADNVLKAQLYFVEEFVDSSLRRVPLRAELKNPGWVTPGVTATVVVPPVAR